MNQKNSIRRSKQTKLKYRVKSLVLKMPTSIFFQAHRMMIMKNQIKETDLEVV